MKLENVKTVEDLFRYMIQLGDCQATRTLLDNLRCDEGQNYLAKSLVDVSVAHLRRFDPAQIG